jgi:succinyl-diaminopimelate desuccinylase
MNALDLTRELLRFDTINPPGNERDCARRIGSLLESAGFAVAYHEFADKRTSLVARIGGAADDKPLCFTGHIDTVPLGAVPWRVDPFAGDVDAGRIYGRGSTDMKSGIAAFVVAACRLAPRLRATPGIVLVITASEETGCDGARYFGAHPETLGSAGAIVVAEPTGNAPCIGHKGALWLRAQARGVTAHGSMPERGVNAIYKAARAVTKLEQFRFDSAAHAVLGMPSLNVGTIRGGLNVNSVPDAAEIGIDIRTIPEQSHSSLVERLTKLLGEDVALQVVAQAAGIWTDPADAWIQQTVEIAEKIAAVPKAVHAAPYFTDGSILKPAMGDPPTVILGPGDMALAHQTDEYCEIERIDQAVEVYSEIAVRWCGL